MITVPEFVARNRTGAFAWGQRDCCIWPADFVRAATGIDPAEGWRGAYSTAWEARKIITREGGLLTVWRNRMRAFGPGADVGVALVNGRRMGGLQAGGFFYALAEQGGVLMTREFTLLAGWAV